MDKELIERTVANVVTGLKWDLDAREKADMVELVTRCLARIDAERGKGGVVTKLETSQLDYFRVSFEDAQKLAALPTGAKLFLSPTIPDGMVLVPIEPTAEMLLVMQDAIHGGYDDERRLYAAIRGAAQGERNAD